MENYSLLIMGVSNGNEDGGGVNGDGSGGIPVPARCRNRDFCPPKLIFDGGGVAELFVDGCWTI
jgi:hypothetical protein